MILVGVDQIEFDDSFLQNDPKVKEFMNVKQHKMTKDFEWEYHS